MPDDMKLKLSYDSSRVPSPVTNPDWYAYANLVEQRAIRIKLSEIALALQALVVAIEKSNQSLSKVSPTATSKKT